MRDKILFNFFHNVLTFITRQNSIKKVLDILFYLENKSITKIKYLMAIDYIIKYIDMKVRMYSIPYYIQNTKYF